MNCLRLLVLLLVAVLAGCASQNPNLSGYSANGAPRTAALAQPPHDMWDRIRRGFAIPDLDDDLTEQWTEFYASRPQSVQTMSQRASKYLYYIVDELERRGLPTELALLPFVESAYNPAALSRSQASGLWQFIPSTGKHYNLQQDWWKDQRRDPVASTNAALEYLSYLYDFQGDWYLALASYNWGEGSVKRAIEKNEKASLPTDYISLKMPDETRNYVPKLQAIKNIIANPEKYGITLPQVSNEPYFATVEKNEDMDLAVAAKLAEMPLDEFKELNPSFNRPVVLAAHNPVLLLPTDRVDIFNANLEAYQGKLSSWDIYKSKKGESYAAIAKRHGISLGKLRAVNGLSSRQSRAVAQTLLVPANASSTGGIQLASLEVPEAPSSQSSSPGKRSDIRVLRRGSNVRTHTVKNGDTLFALAKRYNTSVNELRKLNNLKGNLLPKGKRLRVPGTGIRG